LLAIDPTVLRVFHSGDVHAYRVHLESSVTSVETKIDYVLWSRCKAAPKTGEEQAIEVRIDGFRVSAGGRVAKEAHVGAGVLSISGAGLPDLLAARVARTDFWYPLLAWYVPVQVDRDGSFTGSQALGNGMQFQGKGILKDGEYNFSGKLADDQGAGPIVVLSWNLSPDGWLTTGEGTIVDPSGTVRFTIKTR
jgi:hypothetical protein